MDPTLPREPRAGWHALATLLAASAIAPAGCGGDDGATSPSPGPTADRPATGTQPPAESRVDRGTRKAGGKDGPPRGLAGGRAHAQSNEDLPPAARQLGQDVVEYGELRDELADAVRGGASAERIGRLRKREEARRRRIAHSLEALSEQQQATQTPAGAAPGAPPGSYPGAGP